MPVWFINVKKVAGSIVGRRPSHSDIEALLIDNRVRMGFETLHQKQPREMLRVRRRGETLGILPDQDVDKLPGIFVDFFGRPAYTVLGPAIFAMTTKAKIVPVFLHREGPGRHRLVIHPPVEDPRGEKEERIRAITEDYTATIEAVIGKSPEQWAWVHQRWKTDPAYLERRRARRAKRSARNTRKRMGGSTD